MPWMMQSSEGKTCVYKKGADGKAEGEPLHCYDGEDQETKAKEYMKAMYANADHASSNFVDLEGESLDQHINDVREAFYKVNNGMSGEYPFIKRIYQNYIIIEMGDEVYKVGYSGTGDEIKFDERAAWIVQTYADLAQDFLFVELSASKAEDLKEIDGLAAGVFTSMSGYEVKFESSELPEWVTNTKEVIASTTTKSGEVVGLPIDLNAHDHQGGAGWIVDLELDEERSVIRFLVKWTQAGIDLIKGNIRRFFSPSTDPEEKVVLGGSLTNWPATRDQKGKMLLRPVELSAQIKEIDMEKTVEQLQAELAQSNGRVSELETKIKGINPSLLEEGAEAEELSQWLNNEGGGVEELSKRAQKMAEVKIKAEQRKSRVVEFASKIAGGTEGKPFGLPIRVPKLVKLLLSLPEKQADEVQELVGLIYKNAIDFSEHGFGGEGYFAFKPKLPAELAQIAKVWVENGNSIESWFESMADLGVGNADDYDLRPFKAEEK